MPGIQPGQPPEGADLAIRAWRLMGGLDWAALPIVAECLGVQDIECLIQQLVTIRKHQETQRGQ